MRKKNKPIESVGVKGFTRLQIVNRKDGSIFADTGYMQNQITNYGLESCIVALPLKCANSVQCSGLMLGSGTGVASSGTNLTASASDSWKTFAQSTVSDSLTARATASIPGSDIGATTLQEIGIYAASDGTVIAAKSFSSSAITTDQDVNCTYELRYSTA